MSRVELIRLDGWVGALRLGGRLGEEGSLAVVDLDDGAAAQDPRWVRSGWEDVAAFDAFGTPGYLDWGWFAVRGGELSEELAA